MTNFSLSFIFTFMALVLVLVLAWLILRGLAKMNITKSRSGRIELIDSVPLGSRERLVLIKFDEQELLLGVTAHNVSRLDFPKKLPPRENPS